MPSFLLDENQRGSLWNLCRRHNTRGLDPIDVVCVGDPPAPPLGTDDPELLCWCEEQDRILVTFDRNSMPLHLQDHLMAGRHSPGIFMLNPTIPLPEVLDFLVLATYASNPDEWRDWIKYL